jgi:hypothetical protein
VSTVFLNDWLVALFGALMAACCFLYINAQPRKTNWVGKGVALFIGLGAFGLGVSPFLGRYEYPSTIYVFYVAGTACVAVWVTRHHWERAWCEVKGERPCAKSPDAPPRRGIMTEIAELAEDDVVHS